MTQYFAETNCLWKWVLAGAKLGAISLSRRQARRCEGLLGEGCGRFQHAAADNRIVGTPDAGFLIGGMRPLMQPDPLSVFALDTNLHVKRSAVAKASQRMSFSALAAKSVRRSTGIKIEKMAT